MKLTDKTLLKRYCIYLIGNLEHSFYKIGISRDMRLRMRNFRGLPFPVFVLVNYELKIDEPRMQRRAALAVERGLHTVFHETHLQGEWFKDVDLSLFVDSVKNLEGVFLAEEK